MSNIELALTNLGEAAAVEIHEHNNSIGLDELKVDTNKAGNVLNKAKTELEKELEHTIVSKANYLALTNNKIIENKKL